jgi:hypothetical protein
MLFKKSFETLVRTTEAGYLSIEQPDEVGDDSHIILLSPEQAQQLASYIQRKEIKEQLNAAWRTSEVA